jgi:hypothetical protein
MNVYYDVDDVVDEYNYQVIHAQIASADPKPLLCQSRHKRYHDGRIACGCELSRGVIPVPDEWSWQREKKNARWNNGASGVFKGKKGSTKNYV